MPQVQHSVHVGVGEVAKKLALWSILAWCERTGQQQRMWCVQGEDETDMQLLLLLLRWPTAATRDENNHQPGAGGSALNTLSCSHFF